MRSRDELIQSFRGFQVPDLLLSLMELQEQLDGTFLSDGFELIAEDVNTHSVHSTDPAFLNALITFANADGTGSQFAFWVRDERQSLADAPVLVFGSEGGIHVVARNLKELLHLISFDAEPMIDFKEVLYYKDDQDHEPSDGFEEYASWLREKLGLEPITDPGALVKAAQDALKPELDAWLRRYVS